MSNQSTNGKNKTQSQSALGLRASGAGLAELPVPGWARAIGFFVRVGIFFCIIMAVAALTGWHWIERGLTGGTAALTLTALALGVAAAFFLGRKFDSRLLNLRKAESGARVFGGLHSSQDAVTIGGVTALVLAAALAGAWQLWSTFPLPRALSVITVQATPPSTGSGGRPVYLWDYATWVDPAIFDTISIIVPYEKGPPQKLLSKVYFEDDATRSVILELHGKRPRFYSQETVSRVFDHGVADPRTWPELWRLLREAGLSAAGRGKPLAEFSLIRLVRPDGTSDTQAIGVPWTSPVAPSNNSTSASGRFFFWGPGGTVFQVHCPSPCAMSRVLELVEFPTDPKGSLRERLDWTQKALRQLLQTTPGNNRRRHETLLSLYLVSLLTLDPRDPEAFFHLGKLAHNRETLDSAIRYGRDLGLEPAKIAELQAAAARLTH